MNIREKMALETKVVSDPGILGGRPVVIGTRVPADNVMAMIRANRSRRDIFRAYPSLPPDGIDVVADWYESGQQL